jgi:hypothetical protein
MLSTCGCVTARKDLQMSPISGPPRVGGGPEIPPSPNNPANNNSTNPAVPGVWGSYNTGGIAIQPAPGPDGIGGTGVGVYGSGSTGVQGSSFTGVGVFGLSNGFDAVVGESTSPLHAGVTGRNTSTSPGPFSAGVYGTGGRYAGKFDGDLQVNGSAAITGTLTVNVDIILAAAAADCAEEFEIGAADQTEPGTVMVLDDAGVLQASSRPYDRKVAGVISGAGPYRPGIVLGRGEGSPTRLPVALVGKVFCKVDAQYGPVEVGDLLTTSPTPGHAMNAQDRSLAFGAVIGKALQRLAEGCGLVPILVALQ